MNDTYPTGTWVICDPSGLPVSSEGWRTSVGAWRSLCRSFVDFEVTRGQLELFMVLAERVGYGAVRVGGEVNVEDAVHD